ncbi:sulfatase-like hydrolase/transferase [Roseibacillus persicicus]|uniref:Arylsulfatase n=1 Tax=Roseibacillus persicicus TaxID=454148 RepID=A0A918WHT8_9BACT|nr:sulfatase-like hydrolase/transferase [Roseibacillus persicicus]GHC47768.1 arylsulfatase [Roseibacillus persicicus]
MKPPIILSSLALFAQSLGALEKPNIILVFADDISARELPLYGSSSWSPPAGGDTNDPAYRAHTPVLEQMAEEGCWIETAWAATVCSPSRAMMMTGRYAHLHKWWHNKDVGLAPEPNPKKQKWNLCDSSPIQLGHVAQKAGYATYWAGKTQMPGDLRRYGYDEGCLTPGNLSDTDNPFTDFKHFYKKVDGKRVLFDVDTGKEVDTYQQHGWYWYPHVRLMNAKGKSGFQWWPNTEESIAEFGLGTYGPDVELDFVFDYMDRQKEAGKPFFIYHCSHLGHDAWDWLNPASSSKWPGTPVIKWTGKGYERTTPHITGDQGKYETHGTVTEPGIHHHVNYLDYQIWLYQKKIEEMGIADNTVLIFCADNGTSGYGKSSSDRQKGTHVPLIIHAPGLTKRGKQDILVNLSDFLPTIAELTGYQLPADYEINGESLVPFLFSDKTDHRDWIYAYQKSETLIRGRKVMKDGRGKWWDVENTPADLISFPQIKDWKALSPEHRAERKKLTGIIPRFDLHATQHDAPANK